MNRIGFVALAAVLAAPPAFAKDQFCEGLQQVRLETYKDAPFRAFRWDEKAGKELQPHFTPTGWEGATCKAAAAGDAVEYTCTWKVVEPVPYMERVGTRFDECHTLLGTIEFQAKFEMGPKGISKGVYKRFSNDRVLFVVTNAQTDVGEDTISTIVRPSIPLR